MQMNTELIEKIKKRILNKIDLVTDDIRDLKEMTKPISPENAIGRISRMDAINNKSVNEAALRTAESTLIKLNEALRRLETEDGFGLCRKCGKEIQQGRLFLMPESPLCVPCAS